MSTTMLFRNTEAFKETMPQTVPGSAGFSPLPDYLSSFAADSFDLSLLPDDGAVPSSPTQLMALYEANAPSPPAFHDPLFDFKCYIKAEPSLSPCSSSGCSSGLDYAASSASSSCSSPSGAQRCPSPDLHDLFQDSDTSEFNTYFQQQVTPTRDANLRSLLQEPSVRSTAELQSLIQDTTRNSNLRGLLQEPPVRSNSDLKALLQDTARNSAELHSLLSESLIETQSLQELLKPSTNKRSATDFETQSLQELLKPSINKRSAPDFESPRPTKRPATDHQLLREVLRDTSFQRKFNVRSQVAELDAGLVSVKREPGAADVAASVVPQQTQGALGGELSCDAERIEPVLSLALQQLRRDVDNTCSVLGISPEPSVWTVDDVKAWLLWTLRQFSLPMIAMEYFNMDGAALAALTEQDFLQRAPQCGSTLYAQLEVWKATSGVERNNTGQHWVSVPPCENNSAVATPVTQEPSEDDEEELEDVASPVSSAASVASVSTAPTRGGGSHIHLWQFLKELLSQPQVHGSCIRWLDRPKGVFKIEDSVRVARLWGRRKNRPAMNYDKLSRSIRQYYKKGIMKKTERSQRLVYQFCHPYCL